MKVILVCSVSLLVGTALAVEHLAVTSSATHEPAVQMLGGYELPYSGPGSVIYDSEDATWTIAFEAPEDAQCTELGYAFAADPRAPLTANLDGLLDITGTLDVERSGDSLFVSIADEDMLYSFVFYIDGELPTEALDVAPTQADTLRVAQDCPGGSCSCHEGCKACCSTGFHPNCKCAGNGHCRCIKNVDKYPGFVVDSLALERID